MEGSIICGSTDATTYFLRSAIICDLVNDVRKLASVGFNAMNTLPYSGGS